MARDHGRLPAPQRRGHAAGAAPARTIDEERGATGRAAGKTRRGRRERPVAGGRRPQARGRPVPRHARLARVRQAPPSTVSAVSASTAYPEGHPLVARGDLETALSRKIAYANATDTDMWIVTQFTFASAHAIAWLAAMRDRGCPLPVYIGLPGPARLRTLLAYAARCGVRASARALTRQPSVIRLLKSWSPDDLLQGLAQYRVESPRHDPRRYPPVHLRRAAPHIPLAARQRGDDPRRCCFPCDRPGGLPQRSRSASHHSPGRSAPRHRAASADTLRALQGKAVTLRDRPGAEPGVEKRRQTGSGHRHLADRRR